MVLLFILTTNTSSLLLSYVILYISAISAKLKMLDAASSLNHTVPHSFSSATCVVLKSPAIVFRTRLASDFLMLCTYFLLQKIVLLEHVSSNIRSFSFVVTCFVWFRMICAPIQMFCIVCSSFSSSWDKSACCCSSFFSLFLATLIAHSDFGLFLYRQVVDRCPAFPQQ